MRSLITLIAVIVIIYLVFKLSNFKQEIIKAVKVENQQNISEIKGLLVDFFNQTKTLISKA